MLDWVNNKVVRDTFPEAYNIATEQAEDTREIDELTGLPYTDAETIFSKYGVYCKPNKNSFHESLQRQFDSKGFLSPKQVNALR